MMRSPLIEISIPGLHQQRPQYPVCNVTTEKGSFTVTQRPLRHIFELFELNAPQVIYSFRFASNIASSLEQGKIAEVKCGTNNFLAQQLTQDSPIQSIKEAFKVLNKAGNKQITAEVEYNKQPGLFGYLQKRNISVVFRAKPITIQLSKP